jgi:GDPmannose 4,6-dehydratase
VVDVAFAHLGLDPSEHVGLDPKLLRPAEVFDLVADWSKAHDVLGWEPGTDFKRLIELMVDADVEMLERRQSEGAIP